jgi:hypothetical protein
MPNYPLVKTINPNLAYATGQYDDPLDTYDSSSSYDGSVAVQTGSSDQINVDVITQ